MARFLSTLSVLFAGLALGLLSLVGQPTRAQHSQAPDNAGPSQAPSAVMKQRLPAPVQKRLERARARRQRGTPRARPATERVPARLAPESDLTPAQSWELNENPNPRLNFSLVGPPQYAGDVDGDGTNDYLYASASARDERTSALEDQVGKTALYLGGAPAQEEDQFFYERLTPAGDLDGDGDDDAVALNGADDLRLYAGGSGGYTDSGVTRSRGQDGTGVAGFSDLDDDGYDDVALYDESTDEFEVLFGAPTLGNTVLEQYGEADNGPYNYINTADLDEDGQATIVRLFAYQDAVVVRRLAINAERSVTKEQEFAASDIEAGANQYEPALIDINGNGQRELAITSRFGDTPTYVYRLDGSGTFSDTPTATFTKDDAIPVGDLDGDGRHDFYTFDEDAGAEGRSYVAYGPATLADGLSFDTEIPYDADVSGAAEFTPYGGLGDVTGDGRPDVGLGLTDAAAGTVGRRFFSVTSERAGQAPADVTYPRGHFFDRIDETNEIGDFNGDGTTDFAVVRNSLNEVNVFYGGSSISSRPDLTVTPPTGDASVSNVSGGDVNDDGASDLLLGGDKSERIDIYFGGSGADATADHSVLAEDVGFPIHFPRAVGDVNDDGATDWIATDRGFNDEYSVSGQNVAIFFGGASLPTTADQTMQYPDGRYLGEVKAGLGDVNGDGIDDFGFGNGTADQIDVFFGSASPSFDRPADLALPVAPYAGLAGGDFNGDGVSDIAALEAYRREGTQINIFYGGTGVDATRDQRLPIPAGVGGGDFDGDGLVEYTIGVLESPGDVDGDGADDLIHGSSFVGFQTNALLYRPKIEDRPALIFRAPNTDAALGSQQFVWSAAMGDVTGNGTLDFLTASTERDGGTVSLSWDAVSTDDVDGYDVYRAPGPFRQPGEATKVNGALLSTPSFTDGSVDRGIAYRYRVVAVDTDGNESGPSRQATGGLYASTFGVQRTAANLPSSAGGATAAADVNGDGAKDVLSVGRTGSALYLGNADGTFSPANAGLDDIDGDAAIADLNGDGHQDLLLGGQRPSNAEATLLYFGDGTGAFSKAGGDPFPSNIGNGGLSVTDVDGDGDKDVFIRNRLFLGDGSGGFSEASVDLKRGTDSSVGDFNNDGAPDVLITGRNRSGVFSTTAAVYLGDGSGGFSEVEAGLTGIWSGSSAFGDVDGDGNQDVVIVGNTEVNSGPDSEKASATLYLGNGDGTFQETGASLTPLLDGDVSLADVNGDDHADVLLSGGEPAPSASTKNSRGITRLYLSDGSGGLTPADAGLSGVYGSATSLADLDGDGDRDLLVTGYGERTGQPLTRLYVNRSLQTPPNRAPQFLRMVQDTELASAGETLTQTVEVGDPDGDAIAEVRSPTANATVEGGEDGIAEVTFTPDRSQAGQTVRLRVEAEDAKGASASATASVAVPRLLLGVFDADLTGLGRSSTAMADVNGDGRQDVLAAGYKTVKDTNSTTTTLYLGDGAGGFSEAGAGLADVGGGSTAIADVDADGHQDLLITGYDRGREMNVTTLYMGDGAGGFSKAGAGLANISVASSVFADLNEDGDQDLLLSGDNSSNDARTLLYLGDGTGSFTEADVGFPELDGSLSVADVNADGHLDVLMAGRDEDFDRLTKIYLGEGEGAFTPARADLTPVTHASTSIADVNADGQPDLLITGEDDSPSDAKTATLYRGNGEGGFTAAEVGLTGVEYGSTAIADVDADGHRDLLITGRNADPAPTATLYLNDGDGGFTDARAGLSGVGSGGAVSLGDVEGDGDPDLLITGKNGENTRTATLYENLSDRAVPVAAVSTPVNSDGEVDFGATGVNVTFSGVSNSGNVTVEKFGTAPSNTESIDESNVSTYRLVIDASSSLDFDDDTELRIDVSTLGGVDDPSEVQIYRRSTPGAGMFDALDTDYDAPGRAGRLRGADGGRPRGRRRAPFLANRLGDRQRPLRGGAWARGSTGAWGRGSVDVRRHGRKQSARRQHLRGAVLHLHRRAAALRGAAPDLPPRADRPRRHTHRRRRNDRRSRRARAVHAPRRVPEPDALIGHPPLRTTRGAKSHRRRLRRAGAPGAHARRR
ncbi:MAG: hypothetical protein BRD40_04400 [Bacteroidetes bacterium QS_1_65_9]|nr:MAG: hypothetical protein BRD40_04400 [Bacteroidetes bacterium QS_1_65_9]